MPDIKVHYNRLPKRIYEFINTESASGVVMIIFAVLAILFANSPLLSLYKEFIDFPITFGFSDYIVTEPFKHWVQDILMVFFFLIIGLELKREMYEGFLSKSDQIMLPLLAALGGIIVPALIFLGFNYSHLDTIKGWAIPSTDIAFAIAILSLLGKNIPPSIKIFLLAIAIFDDIAAILIIAVLYNTEITFAPILFATIAALVLVSINRARVTSIVPYILVGICLWFCFYYAGIHTTLAGVIIGLAIPMQAKDKTYSPLNKCIKALHPWVSFVVLPLFAFTSAGVELDGLNIASFLKPLPIGIALGLFFGKQIGIFGTSWLLIKTKIVTMPDSATFKHLYAVSVIAGIGFTMSLFIGMLAFSSPHFQDMVKIGVLLGSMLSIAWAWIILKII